MSTRQYKKSNVRRLYIPLICLTLTSYFFYHSMIGQYGAHNYRAVLAKTEDRKKELAELQIERERLKYKVTLLQNGTIERDMLEQQVRYHLNLAQEDEVLVLRSTH